MTLLPWADSKTVGFLKALRLEIKRVEVRELRTYTYSLDKGLDAFKESFSKSSIKVQLQL